jgi:hypothetical protein
MKILPAFSKTTLDGGNNFGGIAWFDYNGDGYLDLVVANGVASAGDINFIFQNNGDETLSQIAADPLTSDVGHPDLFIFAGAGHNSLYHNNGNGTFTRLAAHDLVADAGDFAGVAWSDLDNDGFPDLFVPAGQPSLLYHNQGNSNSWITFKLVGTVSNCSGIGAKVRVEATICGNSYWQMREISNGDGLAGNSLNAHFGLGDATEANTVRIEWPSGTVQEFRHIALKQILTVTEPAPLQATITNGAPQFTLRGGRNLQYEIDSSTNLLSWSLVGTVTITPRGPALKSSLALWCVQPLRST